MQSMGIYSNLIDEIRNRCRTIHDEYSRIGHIMSGRELLLSAALEIENDRSNRTIDRGHGPGASSIVPSNINSKIQPYRSYRDYELKEKLKISFDSNSGDRNSSDRNRKKSRRPEVNKRIMSNSTVALDHPQIVDAIDKLNNSPALDIFTDKYHDWKRTRSQADDDSNHFLFTFAEYVLHDGELPELANNLGLDLPGLEVAAQLVQSTLQINDDHMAEAKAREDEAKRVAAEQRAARDREREAIINMSIQAGREVATKAINDHLQGLAPSEDPYEKEDYSDNDTYIMGNQSYKHDKYNKEFGNNKPKLTYQNYQSRPPSNTRQVTATQAPSRPPTPPDHCATCGQHKDECQRIAPNYKDENGVDQCYLKDELHCRVYINMVALDMLKLAELPQQQMEKVINSAAKYGCLYGMNFRDVEKLKSKVPKSKENIRQSLQIKNDK